MPRIFLLQQELFSVQQELRVETKVEESLPQPSPMEKPPTTEKAVFCSGFSTAKQPLPPVDEQLNINSTCDSKPSDDVADVNNQQQLQEQELREQQLQPEQQPQQLYTDLLGQTGITQVLR